MQQQQQQQSSQASAASHQVHAAAAAAAAAIINSSSSNSSINNVQLTVMDMEADDTHGHGGRDVGAADGWVYVPPNTIRDMHFGEPAPDEEHAPQEKHHAQVQPEHAHDGQLYSIEDEIVSEEPQVATALDGQPSNHVVWKEHHF